MTSPTPVSQSPRTGTESRMHEGLESSRRWEINLGEEAWPTAICSQSPGSATPALLHQVALAPSIAAQADPVPSLSALALPSPCYTVSGHPNAAAVSMHCGILCLALILL